MKEALHEHVRAAVRSLLDASGGSGEGDPPVFTLEVPRSPDHGDFACNAAMVLAKRLGRPPREIAAELVEALGDAGGLVARAEIAGPGFVNLWLAESRWQGLLRAILGAGPTYGTSDAGAGRRVQVEFVSANPTGPLTLGHGRQAVLGDSVDIPTITGDTVVLKIPPATHLGDRLRVRGHGLPRGDGYGKGNQLGQVQVEVPARITAEQEEHLKAFDATLSVLQDTESLRRTAFELLEDCGVREVRLFRDGLIGLNAALGDVPDLVVLDLNLPSLRGEEICRLLRSSPMHSAIRILVCSDMPEAQRHELELLKIGADLYFEKPFIEEAFLDDVVRLLTAPPRLTESLSFQDKESGVFLAQVFGEPEEMPDDATPRAEVIERRQAAPLRDRQPRAGLGGDDGGHARVQPTLVDRLQQVRQRAPPAGDHRQQRGTATPVRTAAAMRTARLARWREGARLLVFGRGHAFLRLCRSRTGLFAIRGPRDARGRLVAHDGPAAGGRTAGDRTVGGLSMGTGLPSGPTATMVSWASVTWTVWAAS